MNDPVKFAHLDAYCRQMGYPGIGLEALLDIERQLTSTRPVPKPVVREYRQFMFEGKEFFAPPATGYGSHDGDAQA